ncbi:Uncharacterised protein g6882 [Pycnogonum litorale]
MDLLDSFVFRECSVILLLDVSVAFINVMLWTNALLMRKYWAAVITIAINLFLMYLLSNEGHHLEEESSMLRDALMKTLADEKVQNKELRRKIKHLIYRLKWSPPSLNCSGFFKINRSFFLSAVGIIGSYGVVLLTLY